jgi:hypothetical protein
MPAANANAVSDILRLLNRMFHLVCEFKFCSAAK